MPKSPKAPPPIDVTKVTAQNRAEQTDVQKANLAQATMGNKNALGGLTYKSTIDPITGETKYEAVQEYTPEEQAIFDYLQSNRTSLGAGAGGAIGSNMEQWTQPFDLVGGANDLTQRAMDPAMANLERFMEPEREQKRTELLNQGIMEGSKTYQLEMDKLTNQQGLTKGGMIAQFMPQAEKMALDQYNAPINMIDKMLGLSQPGNIAQNLVNTPQANQTATDVAGLATTAQEQAFKNYQQKVASQNAMMDAIMKGGIGLASLPMGGGTAGMSLGGSLINNIMPK